MRQAYDLLSTTAADQAENLELFLEKSKVCERKVSASVQGLRVDDGDHDGPRVSGVLELKFRFSGSDVSDAVLESFREVLDLLENMR